MAELSNLPSNISFQISRWPIKFWSERGLLPLLHYKLEKSSLPSKRSTLLPSQISPLKTNGQTTSNAPTPSSNCSHFCGNIIKTTVTSDLSVAEKWINQIVSNNGQQRSHIVVVTAERNPNAEKIATLQLCVKRWNKFPSLSKIFFSDETVSFHGLKIYDIEEKLQVQYGVKFQYEIGPVACLMWD